MIDMKTEAVVTFAQAADELPRRRRGRKCSASTLYRWSTIGCRGIRLETIQVGGTRCTSREALQRFFDALAPDAKADPSVADGVSHSGSRARPGSRSPARRRRDTLQAERELEAAGI